MTLTIVSNTCTNNGIKLICKKLQISIYLEGQLRILQLLHRNIQPLVKNHHLKIPKTNKIITKNNIIPFTTINNLLLINLSNTQPRPLENILKILLTITFAQFKNNIKPNKIYQQFPMKYNKSIKNQKFLSLMKISVKMNQINKIWIN